MSLVRGAGEGFAAEMTLYPSCLPLTETTLEKSEEKAKTEKASRIRKSRKHGNQGRWGHCAPCRNT